MRSSATSKPEGTCNAFIHGDGGTRKGEAGGVRVVDDYAHNPGKVAAVVAECNAQGVIIGMTNRSLPGLNNTLCLSPALIATPDDIDQITGAIDRALTKVFG